RETVPGIYRIILLKSLAGFVFELFEFAGDSDALGRIPGAQLLECAQARFQPERRNHVEQFLPQPTIHRGPTKTQAVRSTVVITSIAEITRVRAPAAPVTYVQFSATARNAVVLPAGLVRHVSLPWIHPPASLRNFAASFVDSLHRWPSQYIPHDDEE